MKNPPAAVSPFRCRSRCFKNEFVFRAALLLGWAGAAARAEEPVRVACPCVADTTIDAAQPSGRDLNAGSVEQLHTAGNQRYALLRFDVSKLDGLEITKATLRVRRVQDLLVRAGISTVAAEWGEGTAKTSQASPGGACYNFAAYAEQPRNARSWAEAGSDFSDVVFGNGGSRWTTVTPHFDKQTFWYEIDVPPAFVQAMAQGLQSASLCIADDFGRYETSPTFHSRESNFAPELVVEGKRAAFGAASPPADVRALRDELGLEWVTFTAPKALGFEIYLSEHPLADADQLAKARKLDLWAMPAPGGGALRALLSLFRNSQQKYVTVRVMEAAGQWSPLVGAELPAPVGENPAFSAPQLPRHDLPAVCDAPFTMDDGPALSEDGKWMRSAAKTWWDPRHGPITLQAGRNEFVAFQVILAGGSGAYRVNLTDWQPPGAAEPAPRVRLFKQHYVRSRLGKDKYAPEVAVPMQPGETLQLDLSMPEAVSSQPATQPATHPASGGPPAPTEPAKQPRGGPWVDSDDPHSLTVAAQQDTPQTSRPAKRQKAPPEPASQPAPQRVVQGVWVEIYVPHQTPVGVWRSRVIVLRDGVALLDIPLELEIVEPTLPDALQFKVSLNTNAVPGPLFNVGEDSPEAWDVLNAYYRLAHEHRATLGITPYTQEGKVHAGFAPRLERDGQNFRCDWSEWDRRFGGYFDGAAFRGLPRDGAPLDHFYLPFNENWPLPLEFQRAAADSPLAGKYHYETTWTESRRGTRAGPHRDAYMVWPIEAALGNAYQAGTRAVLRQFAEHLSAERWNRTDFLICPRNKYVFSAATNWWLLSEPEVPDDFRALRFWLDLYRQELNAFAGKGVDASGGKGRVPIKLGAQISNPQLERGLLDGLLDQTALNPALQEKNRLILGAPRRFGALWCYGDGAIAPEQGWSAVQMWVWAARLAGAGGVLQTQALGRDKSWDVADDEALLYPTARLQLRTPYASLRLKMLCRAQQDMDWLERYLTQVRARNIPEGYGLAVVGQELAARTDARTPRWATLLPVVRFPGRLDTVAFEEVRRGLRAAKP